MAIAFPLPVAWQDDAPKAIAIEPTDSVPAVKLRIQQQLGFPADMQKLIWQGKPLADATAGRCVLAYVRTRERARACVCACM